MRSALRRATPRLPESTSWARRWGFSAESRPRARCWPTATASKSIGRSPQTPKVRAAQGLARPADRDRLDPADRTPVELVSAPSRFLPLAQRALSDGVASTPLNSRASASISAAVLDLSRGLVLCRGLLGGRLVQLRHFLAVEINRYAARIDVAGGALSQVIDVIPTFLVERIRDHRRAQQVPDLTAGHSGFDLFHRRLVQEIALLNIDAVHTSASQ